MSIKKFFIRLFRFFLFAVIFIIGFIGGISFVVLLYNTKSFNKDFTLIEEISRIRTDEVSEGNYEIENWTAYERNGSRLLWGDGALYEFGLKYFVFQLSNGLLFGKSYDISEIREEKENDLRNYPYIRYGDLLWMTKNLSLPPKEFDFVTFDAVAGLKIVPKSVCLYDKKSNCEKYGRFYDYSSALTICPDTWRLPKNDEWLTLKGKIDSLKFANEFAGSFEKNCYSGIYEFVNEGKEAIWWSYSEDDIVYNLRIDLSDNMAAEKENDLSLHSVRCVKDVSVPKRINSI